MPPGQEKYQQPEVENRQRRRDSLCFHPIPPFGWFFMMSGFEEAKPQMPQEPVRR